MTLPVPVEGLTMPLEGPLLDRFGRAHTYLRLSVTDRCNFRCTYCLPDEGVTWLPRDQVLTIEEQARLVRVFAGMGIRRLRLTGGEPTIRHGLVELVRQIAAIDGIDDLAMTTNAHKLAPLAADLAAAGLRRINISIDSLDPEAFGRITRGGDLARVLAGIEAARAAGLAPIKLNAVIVAGDNEDALFTLVEHFGPHAATTHVRFIEAMPFGDASRRNHLAAAEMRRRLDERFGLERLDAEQGGGPAKHWRVRGSGLIVGFISPITEHFCDTCNRLRLTAEGQLRTCLSKDPTPSLRDLIRQGSTDDELEGAIRWMVWQKVAGHEAHLDDWRAFEGVMTHIGG